MNLLKGVQMEDRREASTPTAASPTSTPQVVEEVMAKERHGLFRMAFGQLEWKVCRKPGSAFTINDLAITLNGPRQEDLKRLRHILRYTELSLTEFGQKIHVRMYADVNCGSCPPARSTSEALTLLFGCPIHFVSLSSAEIELFSLGVGTGEVLHVRTFLLDTKLLNKLNTIMETYSSSGNDCGHLRRHQAYTTYTTSVSVHARAFPERAHEASRSVGNNTWPMSSRWSNPMFCDTYIDSK